MNTNTAVCVRLFMSDIDKAALENHDGKKGIALFVTPEPNQPHGATHAVYQNTPSGPKLIGHGKLYTPRPATT